MAKRKWQQRAEKLERYHEVGDTITGVEKLLVDAARDYEAAEFWKKWVYPEGASAEEVQDELVDYHTFMEQARQVYMHITRGNISKVNTHAFEVISLADEYADADAEDHAEGMAEDLRKQIKDLRDALIWMSGSADFAPGGKAHKGWLKVQHLTTEE